MRRIGSVSLALFLALAMSGCRYKGWESFSSATEPNPIPTSKTLHDAYAFGGPSVASGGLDTKTNYGVGSDPNSPAPINPRFDEPEKGSGQMPGELPNVATPGHAQTNAPAFQPRPGDVSDAANAAHG